MILDTNAVSALLAGDGAIGEALSGAARHHLPVIVLGEYGYGLLRSRHRASLQGLLADLVAHSDLLSVDAVTAAVYAETRWKLTAAGTPIPENDLWIASLALQHSLEVVSLDRHFDRVDGVRRVGW